MRRFVRIASIVAIALVGFCVSQLFQPEHVAVAEIREAPRQVAFESGSERSLKALAAILEQLKSIDARLERIERVVTRKE